jgi:hypothetical protein
MHSLKSVVRSSLGFLFCSLLPRSDRKRSGHASLLARVLILKLLRRSAKHPRLLQNHSPQTRFFCSFHSLHNTNLLQSMKLSILSIIVCALLASVNAYPDLVQRGEPPPNYLEDPPLIRVEACIGSSCESDFKRSDIQNNDYDWHERDGDLEKRIVLQCRYNKTCCMFISPSCESADL